MTLLSDLKLSDNVKQESVDQIGGGFEPLESGLYPVTLGLSYLGESAGGAKFIAFTYKVDGQEHNEDVYITSGKDKGCKPTYTDKQTGEELPLPGYVTANSILQLATGKPLDEQEFETRTVKVYDSKEGKRVPKPMPCLVAALDANLVFGILRTIENKRTRVEGKGYVSTNESRTFNEISAVCGENGLTLNEVRAGIEEPVFIKKWENRWSGKDNDRFKPTKTPAGTKNPATGNVSTSRISFD